MKPDLIICWPIACDYPLWRQFIRDNRDRFNKVIIVFTWTNYGIDYRNFIRNAMLEDNCVFVDPLPIRGDQDWRDVSVKAGLLYATSDWVYFTEQDFLPITNQFWLNVDSLKDGFDVFGLYQDTRLHPCCLFMKRETLLKTKRNFGVVKDRLDHFGKIQEDLEDQNIKIGRIDPALCRHMNGLSQNLSLLYKGSTPNYQPEEFKEYLKACKTVRVPQSIDFIRLANSYLGEQLP